MRADQVAAALFEAAEAQQFCGVVRVGCGEFSAERGFGLANRAYQVPNTPETKVGVASVTKGFTALVIGSLIDEGRLGFDTLARDLLGADLPQVADRVTIDHLLCHRSGIGDYFDESAIEDTLGYPMPVPVHTLDATSSYLSVLDRPQVSVPGKEFAYNNSGYVLLALIAERAAGQVFPELVRARVFSPSNMVNSGFFRMDELGADVARGYVGPSGLRTNVLHLPVLGSGDGGAFTTVADLARFWPALLSHRIVTAATLDKLLEPNAIDEEDNTAYARGFYLDLDTREIALVGEDVGQSARTWHVRSTGDTGSILGNVTDTAGPLFETLDD